MKDNKFKLYFVAVKNFFNNLLFPEDIKCIFCGVDIPNFEEKPFCEECEKEISFNRGDRCIICAEPIGNEAMICDACQKNKRSFKRAFCPLIYDGLVRRAILGYKDKNQRYLAKAFAKMIAKEIEEAKVFIDKITYIPLTKKKLRRRSFNQSKLLAEHLAKVLNVPCVDVFEKTREGKVQKESSFKERQENMKGLFVLKKEATFNKGEVVLIVDDIITTCATVNYCASLLKDKVKDVYVCAVARNRRGESKIVK